MKIILITFGVLTSCLIFGMFSPAFGFTDSCRCVAFRLDDVQDYYLNKVQIEIINTFQTNDTDLTVGIIGKYFGNDTMIVKFFKEKLRNNTSLEIANHGWNHEDFTSFEKQEQSQLIKKTNEKIFNILQVTTDGFIPPFNKINDNTIIALHENKIKYLSANVTQDVPHNDTKQDALYHLPSTSSTGDLSSDNTSWYGINHKETLVQIQSSLINYGFSVVTLHPQEYSIRQGLNFTNEVESGQVQELGMLIDEIKNSGLNIVTIKEIPQHLTIHQETPTWIKRIFVWHEQKKISADEVLNAIKFLTEKNIIKINR